MKKITRRAFLATAGLIGGGLVVGVAVAPNRLTYGLADKEGERSLNTWVKITPDNRVTILVPHAEMGQGAQTALAMMLAEEMEADWSLVSVEQAPAASEYANHQLARAYLAGAITVPDYLERAVDFSCFKLAQMMDFQVTGGSTAVGFTGEWGMRRAGASAKEMLLEAASRQWQVPVSELTATASHVHHAASGNRATFGDLASAAAAIEPPLTPKQKSPSEFTIIGQPKERFDIPAKVDGSARFGIDVVVPEMLYGAIRQSPVFGGTVGSVDPNTVDSRRGVVKVVALDSAVVVVADNYWRAEQAVRKLDVEFNAGPGASQTSESIFADFERALASEPGAVAVDEGNTNAAFADAAEIVEAAYRVPFLAHATMEPMNCTAQVKDGWCDIWVGHQNPLAARAAAAEAAGLGVEQVVVHNTFLGGGFGRRQELDFVVYAVEVAKAVGAPVKLIWSREQDIQHDFYRPAVANRFKAGLDAEGNLTAWSNRYTDTYLGVGEPHAVSDLPYDLPNRSIRRIKGEVEVPVGRWRSVFRTQHAFFNESFIDELAHAAGKDPFAFRRDLLSHSPRHRKVLELAAEEAGWSEPLPPGRARGIALENSFGSIVAEVAEVSVTPQGHMQVHKVTAAVDCGRAVNPDGAEAQIQGGIIFGLTAACYGEIGIENGAVIQSNFPDYEMIRLETAPKMAVHFIESGERIGGLGEPGTPPIAPAVANAIFAVTGKRIRSLPILAHDLSYPPEGRTVPA
jgi:isoquinoline 1-oxidoreductase subunit beta